MKEFVFFTWIDSFRKNRAVKLTFSPDALEDKVNVEFFIGFHCSASIHVSPEQISKALSTLVVITEWAEGMED